MSYTRAISSLGWPDSTLEDLLALAARHQLEAVELRALENTVDLPNFFLQRFGTPAELTSRLETAPSRVVAFDTTLRLLNGTPADRDKLLAYVPWAEAAGAKWLRVLDGGKTADDNELAHAAGTLRWWQTLRRERGWKVDLMVETHDTLVSKATLLRFLEAVPGVRLLWDAHQTWKKSGEDPVDTWRALRKSVVHVHVKDSISTPSPGHPFTYVLPGAGEFPAARLGRLLRTEFTGAVCLEWEKLWHSYLPDLDQALHAAETHRWW
ncbi:MAG: sugar phosphate isomerase/epimerase [Opitutae bacterium]|nr:sugar phosphate isomerase/epimerase [Opitutae bacterium]